MGAAAAADSAQIRWLLVNSMRQFAPCATQNKYQIELKEDYTSVRDENHTYCISNP